jgi:hypothetical protein
VNFKREKKIHTCEKVFSNYSIVAFAFATILLQLLSTLNPFLPWTSTYFLFSQEEKEEEEGNRKAKNS